MTNLADWAADIMRAADELGYIVEEITTRQPCRVILSDPRDSLDGKIVLEGSIFISGDYLRQRLRAVKDQVPA